MPGREDPRGRVGCLGGKVGSACEELRTMRMVYLVKSSGTS